MKNNLTARKTITFTGVITLVAILTACIWMWLRSANLYILEYPNGVWMHGKPTGIHTTIFTSAAWDARQHSSTPASCPLEVSISGHVIIGSTLVPADITKLGGDVITDDNTTWGEYNNSDQGIRAVWVSTRLTRFETWSHTTGTIPVELRTTAGQLTLPATEKQIKTVFGPPTRRRTWSPL